MILEDAKGYPKSYRTYEEHVDSSNGSPMSMGYACKAATGFRFCNRFRLAKSFKGIELDGYGDSTVKGYNGMMSVFLAYSAYELFWEVSGIGQHEFPHQMNQVELESVYQDFCCNDVDSKLFNFLKARVNPSLKGRLEKLKTGDYSQTVYLAASIRHIFGHGHLAAHNKGACPVMIGKACGSLYVFLMDFMDSEFSKIVSDRIE